ncbi:MAG: efflux RND transporter periplasmic adaptor subunit [Gammaproteobacteria bacterium]|nr:efflux RND transporter periplasmic adaptor subunit [Gammaproteobacteria bacterium]
MTTNESALLEHWLGLLCRMIPGLGQAVLLPDSAEEDGRMSRWPAGCEPREETISTARLAAGQQKTVTTTLAASPGNDAPVDMIIALPLARTVGERAGLAVMVKVKPSQQAAVSQILQWGEDWLELLMNHQQTPGPPSAELPATPAGKSWFAHPLRLALLGLALLLGVAAVTPGTYRVTSPANIEGKVQRAVVAPFDGYIAAAYARAGEIVAAGDIIAELDIEELRLQQQRHSAERGEYDRQYRKALAARDQTQAHIYKSQVKQAEAQLDLIAQKIARAGLTSTLDGVIISGDLSRSLGAPVTTGDVLFEVAPLDEYRLIVQVDQKQVADVAEGQHGELHLRALPGNGLPFVVHKVSPVYEAAADGITYRVEAQLTTHEPALRPGMEGFARIEIGARSLLWIYTHELLDLLRLWAWRWLP